MYRVQDKTYALNCNTYIHTYLFVKHTQFNWTTKDAYASLREYPNVCKHNTKCVTKVNNKIASYFVN